MDTAHERELRSFGLGKGELWAALAELMDIWDVEANGICASQMQPPPDHAQAAYYAARAKTYRELMARIENFAKSL